MLVERSGVLFHYQVKGSGKVPVLLLHGWGRDASYWKYLIANLDSNKTSCRFYIVDMPGFGISAAPPECWGTEDYARFLHEWMDEIAPLDKWWVIGHSFGGKVALFLSKENPQVKRLVLLASAGVPAPKKLAVRLKIACAHFLKKLLAILGSSELVSMLLERYRACHGSLDYRMASGVMRAILVRTLSEDVREYLPDIRIPVLMIWGSLDSATPLPGAQIMQRLLPEARLVVIEGVGHDLMGECPDKVLELIEQNLMGD